MIATAGPLISSDVRKQAFLYYMSSAGAWLVDRVFGGPVASLLNTSTSVAVPSSGWQYYGDDGSWRPVPDLTVTLFPDLSSDHPPTSSSRPRARLPDCGRNVWALSHRSPGNSTAAARCSGTPRDGSCGSVMWVASGSCAMVRVGQG